MSFITEIRPGFLREIGQLHALEGLGTGSKGRFQQVSHFSALCSPIYATLFPMMEEVSSLQRDLDTHCAQHAARELATHEVVRCSTAVLAQAQQSLAPAQQTLFAATKVLSQRKLRRPARTGRS